MRTINETDIINYKGGFTLMELAIVMIIFGLLTFPLLQAYTRYQEKKRHDDTRERIEDAVAQVKIYRISAFSSPCPANAALSINDANYGLQDCGAAIQALPIGSCTPDGGICKVAGARDTSEDADAIAGNGNEVVLIGAYPFRTIAQVNQNKTGIEGGLDGWGHKLTYAVSARTTSLFPSIVRNSIAVGNDFKYGVIQALDEFGNNTAGTDRDAQFVVLSHGSSARGARSAQGVLVQPCSTTDRDRENCDNDAQFMRAIGYYEAAGANFYDDYAYFYKSQTGDLWAYVTSPHADTGSTGHIYNLNELNVGVNTASTAPVTKLDVDGTVRAVTTLTKEICDANNTNCVPTDFFLKQWDGTVTKGFNVVTTNGAGTVTKTWRNTCPSGQLATALANGQIQCVPSVTVPPPSAAVNCLGGFYITKILTNGCIVCNDGGAPICPP